MTGRDEWADTVSDIGQACLEFAMTNGRWSPIRYRDFYDVPRIFVAEHAGVAYMFESRFRDAEDDYSDQYSIYTLSPAIVQGLDQTSDWAALLTDAKLVGQIAVNAVRFDETRRGFVSNEVYLLAL
jgi:hypothetical protein